MNQDYCENVQLLGAEDPVPFEVVPAGSDTPVVLICDHAGNGVPQALISRSPSRHDMMRHIAIDVGAKRLASNIASRLGSGLIMQHYSRLVVDPNRPRHSPQLAPEVSDGSLIPFNQNLSDKELDNRWNLIHQPYHNRISDILDSRAGMPTVFIAIHSFTPKLRGGPFRGTIIDLMVREDTTLAEAVKSAIHRSLPQVSIGINQVFQITNITDYTLPHHAESRKLPHVSIEIRSDWVNNPYQSDYWGAVLAQAFNAALPAVL